MFHSDLYVKALSLFGRDVNAEGTNKDQKHYRTRGQSMSGAKLMNHLSPYSTQPIGQYN